MLFENDVRKLTCHVVSITYAIRVHLFSIYDVWKGVIGKYNET